MIGNTTCRKLVQWLRWSVALVATWLLLAPSALSLPEPNVFDVPDDPDPGVTVPLSIARVDDVLQAAQKRLDLAREAHRAIPLPEVETLINEAERILRDLRMTPEVPALQDLLQAARTKLLQAQIRLMPSRTVELRGVFLDGDAIPPSTEGLAALVRKLKAAGFNAVFPEIFRRGFTMYRSRITEMDPAFVRSGFDVLGALLREAHGQGLEVYPWIWTFRVQSPSLGLGNPILDRLPALAAVPLRKNGSNGDSVDDPANDETMSFISPSSPEWRQLLTTMLAEVVRNYPIDGYVLDYIRYNNNRTEDQLSFTNFQLEYLRRIGAFPPLRFEPGTDLFVEWHLWREEQVHQMVKELTRQLVKARDGLTLGAAVFRGEIHSRLTKMQDWRHWFDNNWLDFAAPMMYTDAAQDLDTWLDWETDLGQRQDMLYPILGAHQFRRPPDLFNQIGLLQSRHIPGVSIFAIRRLSDETLRDLGQGPFRSPARPPHHNVPHAVQQQLRATADWLRSIPGHPATAESPPPAYLSDLQAFSSELQAHADHLLIPEERSHRPDPLALQAALLQIRSRLDRLLPALPGALAAELLHQVDYAVQLAHIYQRHHRPDNGYVQPSRPPVVVLPEARPLPTAPVLPASPPPAIDGRLDDAAWQRVPWLTPFFWHTGSARPQVSTRVRVLYDKEALYIAYENREPRPDRVRARTRLANSERILQGDDTVELFLSPGERSKSYYYFVTNLNGTPYTKASFDEGWSGEWQVAVQHNGSGWNVEVRIPFETLRVPAPEKGGKWRGNFCRRRMQEVNSYHCWSFTFGGIHRADRFGSLIFRPIPSPSPSPGTAVTHRGSLIRAVYGQTASRRPRRLAVPAVYMVQADPFTPRTASFRSARPTRRATPVRRLRMRRR